MCGCGALGCVAETSRALNVQPSVRQVPCLEATELGCFLAGVSEKARRKLNRSGSQSSSEHSQDGRLSPEPQFGSDQTASPANRRKPQRPPPPPAGSAQPGSNRNSAASSKGNFFQTLDWQLESEGLMADDDGGGAEWTSTSRKRFDSVEDEFGQLSVGRVKSAAGEAGEEPNFFNERPRDPVAGAVPEANLFDADFSNVPSQADSVQTGDLLNMSGGGGGGGAPSGAGRAGAAAHGVNLLDTGAPEPSTLELLTGAANLQGVSGNTQGGGSLMQDTFDPFGDLPGTQPQKQSSQNALDLLGGGPSSQPAAAPASAGNQGNQAKPANFDAFDLLGNSSNAASAFGSQQKQNGGGGATASNNFMAFNKAQPQSAQSPDKVLFTLGGDMNLNLNATSPGFGGSNPNLSSYASGGGMGQQKSKAFDTQPSPMGLKDPFADFGA